MRVPPPLTEAEVEAFARRVTPKNLRYPAKLLAPSEEEQRELARWWNVCGNPGEEEEW